MYGSRSKIPSKNLVRQRRAEGFNFGVKGLKKKYEVHFTECVTQTDLWHTAVKGLTFHVRHVRCYLSSKTKAEVRVYCKYLIAACISLKRLELNIWNKTGRLTGREQRKQLLK
jgi:hypothetical protein